MPRTLPSQVLRLIASTAVIVLLTAHPAAAAPQKPAPPPPTSQAQLKARVEDLETRLNEAEKKAALAAIEKDYITRIQTEYEDYYEKAFKAQETTLTIIGIILTAMFICAGVFSFKVFDSRIESSLGAALAQVEKKFSEQMQKELAGLQQQNSAQLNALADGLTKRIDEQEQDLKTRSDFQFQCAQGLATGMGNRYAQARNSFRTALGIYKSSKPRGLIEQNFGAITVQNILMAFHQEDKANFEQHAKKELAKPLYDDLREELALLALDAPELAQLLNARMQAPSQPAAAKPKAPDLEQS
jgi:hypothetical protein